jgi:hypothetical protein
MYLTSFAIYLRTPGAFFFVELAWAEVSCLVSTSNAASSNCSSTSTFRPGIADKSDVVLTRRFAGTSPNANETASRRFDLPALNENARRKAVKGLLVACALSYPESGQRIPYFQAENLHKCKAGFNFVAAHMIDE